MKNKQEKIFWHITQKENLESILKNGIKANDENEVFLLDDREVVIKCKCDKPFLVSKAVALEQLFLTEFVIIAVDVEGLELLPDDVAELTAPFQYIYKGNIPTKRIKGYEFDDTEDYQQQIKEFQQKLLNNLKNKKEIIL